MDGKEDAMGFFGDYECGDQDNSGHWEGDDSPEGI